MIKSKNYKQESPEWIMAKFFDCWKRRAWKQMLDYVHPSWLARHKEPNKILRLSLQPLVDTEFVQMNAKTGAVAVFLVNIYRKSRIYTDQSIHRVRLLRGKNKWGIDPKSVI